MYKVENLAARILLVSRRDASFSVSWLPGVLVSVTQLSLRMCVVLVHLSTCVLCISRRLPNIQENGGYLSFGHWLMSQSILDFSWNHSVSFHYF